MSPRPVTCPWCPGFNPRDSVHLGRSHAMCPSCRARLSTCPSCGGVLDVTVADHGAHYIPGFFTGRSVADLPWRIAVNVAVMACTACEFIAPIPRTIR